MSALLDYHHLTRQQLCAEMQVSESTVRRWEHAGLPYTPIGSRGKRYSLPDIKLWLRNNQCHSDKTNVAAGTSPSWSTMNALSAACRKAQLRVMPSN
jgi:predicted CxxxxCH...CXXCH cytochrome family protein